MRQQLQTTKFFAEEDRESRLWVAPLTTQLIKIFMALSLLVHLKFNYVIHRHIEIIEDSKWAIRGGVVGGWLLGESHAVCLLHVPHE